MVRLIFVLALLILIIPILLKATGILMGILFKVLFWVGIVGLASAGILWVSKKIGGE